MQNIVIVLLILILIMHAIIAAAHIIQMVFQHRKDARLYRKINTILEFHYMQCDEEELAELVRKEKKRAAHK